MKNKSWLSIEKTKNQKKTSYYNYKKLFTFTKKNFLRVMLGEWDSIRNFL